MNTGEFDVPPIGTPRSTVSTSIGENGDWASVVQLAFMEQQINGNHPFVRIVSSEANLSKYEKGAADFLPHGSQIIRDVKSKGVSATLATFNGIWIYAVISRNNTRVVISGPEASSVESVAQAINDAFPEPPQPDDATVPIHIWHQSNNGGSAKQRRLEVPKWADIRDNYSQQVQLQLDELMAMNRPEHNGRLILWHGVPGTGKTTAIRALMSAWGDWCESQYIVDPETAFADPAYLTDLMTRKFDSGSRGLPWYDDDDDFDDDEENPDVKWKLLIAEDSDEFLRADARQSAGAALGRLLNLSDGILGQGSNTLILLTTNEDMRELHPALIRHGRALANTEFTKLSTDESNNWLKGDASVSSPKTLAELFELRGELKRICNGQAHRKQIGFAA